MRYDIAIIGAGIAGASLAAAIGGRASVLLLEAEAQPGYHSTGRSAAFWSETYGGPGVQPLTTASGQALRDGGYLDPMGSLHIGRAEDRGAVDAFLAEFRGSGVEVAEVAAHGVISGLRPEWTLGVLEPSSAFIDVAALHAAYLAQARGAGVTLVCGARVLEIARGWRLETSGGTFEADVIVNAAGAWADQIAALAGVAPIGIQPYRRTVIQMRTDPLPPPNLTHIIDISGNFYIKPEAGGRLWLTPQDETPVEPHDAQPEDIDVAIAIDRFERAFAWKVVAVERRWAGLRSFAADRLPVYGFDPASSRFFWCAGQGGFGIQTAPAAAALAAALLLGTKPDPMVAGIDPAQYSPHRFLPLA